MGVGDTILWHTEFKTKASVRRGDKFGFGYFQYGVSVEYLGRDVQQIGGCLDLEFRRDSP